MFEKKILPLLVGLLAVAIVSCSKSPVEDDLSAGNEAADQFGGYTAEAEAPGFGDDDLLAADGDEREITDPLLTSAAVGSLVDDWQTDVFSLRAVWGQLCYDSTAVEQTDWSGSLTVSRGALIVRRLIRFERGQDQLVERTDRKLVEWISFTSVHNDGVAVEFYVPPARPEFDSSYLVDQDGDSTLVIDTIPAEPFTLTFETGPYSRTFNLRELASLDTVVSLRDGSAVAFSGFPKERRKCPRGTLVGNWGYDDEGNGVYRGSWRSAHGEVTGHLRGHFEENDRGGKVFYGKWIDRSGRFEGFLKGRWGPMPDQHAADIAMVRAGGWFSGKIYNADRRVVGWLKGRYRSAPDMRGGWLTGRWRIGCEGSDGRDDGIKD